MCTGAVLNRVYQTPPAGLRRRPSLEPGAEQLVVDRKIPQASRHLAIASGDIQCAATTVETWIVWNANGVATTQIFQLDKSYGADGAPGGEGENADHIVGGAEWSTLAHDAFPGQEFDFMVANPPYGKSWKKDLEAMGGLVRDGLMADAALRDLSGMADSVMARIPASAWRGQPEGGGGLRAFLRRHRVLAAASALAPPRR